VVLSNEERLRNRITEDGFVDAEEIELTSTLDELGMDELDIVELQMGIEEEFGIDFSPEEDFEAVTSVQQILALINEKTGG
jgi:acyl carrier protein